MMISCTSTHREEGKPDSMVWNKIAPEHTSDNFLLFPECRDGDVRLVGNSNPLAGRLEVCYDRVWGMVCSGIWSSVNAEVVCRQLGYATAGIYSSCTYGIH